MAKTFSIVTPSYNQGKFIAKTLESVLSQVGDFFIDYIILDAVSTDNSVDEIKKYEKLLQDNCDTQEKDGLTYYVARDANFAWNRCLGISYRWWSRKDKGQSDALNQGFNMAEGEIVAWINSDDSYLPDTFKTVATAYETHNIDIVVGDTIAVDGTGKEMWRQTPPTPNLYSLLFQDKTPQQPAIFFSKHLIDLVGGVDENLHYVMDVDLWIKFCFAHARWFKVYQYMAIQIYHEDSKSSQGATLLEKFAPENALIKDRYRKQLPQLESAWYTLKWNFPKPVKDILNKLIAFIKTWIKKLIRR